MQVDYIVGIRDKHKTIASIALRLTVDNVTNLLNGWGILYLIEALDTSTEPLLICQNPMAFGFDL
jgi:hypothetical protein